MNVLIAGHDFKFFTGIRRFISERDGVEVRDDRWRGIRSADHDEARSLELLRWADVVICEWCLSNAVWYAKNKRAGQRLIVRFHRVELETEYPRELDRANVDAMVFVSEHVRDEARARFDWPDDPAFTVIGNAVDDPSLGAEKLPGARFNLGLLGYVPRLKRLDRALDLLELLRVRDQRYRLLLKGAAPWGLSWLWKRDDERRFFERMFARIERSPLLSDAVSFEGFGSAAEWFRMIGFVLSTSDIEGFHLSPAEGMTAGSVPVIVQRSGAHEIFGPRWVHANIHDAARDILGCDFESECTLARSDALERFTPQRIYPRWSELLAAVGART